MKGYVLWALMFVAVQAVLTLVQFLLRKKEFHKTARIVIVAAKVVVAVACATLVMAGPVFLRPVQPLLVVVYAVLFMDAVADAIYSAYIAVKKQQRKFVPVKLLSFILGVVFFVFGTVNMQIVTPCRHEYISSKLTKTHKIVFVADLHVGSSQSFQTTKKTIAAMCAEEPDFIILGGDITDDYTEKEQMQQTYRLLGESGIPVYFVFGNHEVVQHEEYMKDGLHYTEEDLLQTLKENGITVLTDEYVELAPDLLLLGREDVAAKDLRKEIESIPNPSPEKYLITADHQPVKVEENRKVGTDLQLSGHTHAGQLFPNGFLYSFISYNVGDYTSGDNVMNVTSGASGWRVPFRTENACHYEVITLIPEA